MKTINLPERRTAVGMVFDHLYDEIVSMRLLPGTKISEVEIASRFGVSRQPVRDAFSQLENVDLLLIRPQKATEVKRFSSRSITKARFIRAAVEAETLRRAAAKCTKKGAKLLESQLADQISAVAENDNERFCALDIDFHGAVCEVGEADFAVDVIQQEKAKIDRLCVLGLAREEQTDQLLKDHKLIAKRIIANDVEGAVDAGMQHLSRLDSTIDAIRKEHVDYFED